ncbi:hypothetical protein J7438_25230, partial [Thalassotalea sp. G20_0]|uniref:hypothetical protein n=1 Tax=Thalassotalea sp. G20_0 TaxID=2821093 RepID=UPI001ADA642C
ILNDVLPNSSCFGSFEAVLGAGRTIPSGLSFCKYLVYHHKRQLLCKMKDLMTLIYSDWSAGCFWLCYYPTDIKNTDGL